MRNLLAWLWPGLRRAHPELGETTPTGDMEERSGVEMFDHVTIRAAPATIEAGIAGLAGTVYGHTTPSMGLGIEVLGDPIDDLAVNVHLDAPNLSVWLTPDLVQFVERPRDLTIRVGDKWLRRQRDGSWAEISAQDARS